MQNTMRGKFACAFETTDSLQSQLTTTRSVSLLHSLSPRPRLRSVSISYQKQSIHCRAVAEWKTTNVGTQNMYTKTLYIKMFFLSDWLFVVLRVLILRWWFDFNCFKVFLGDNFSNIISTWTLLNCCIWSYSTNYDTHFIMLQCQALVTFQ